MSAVFGWRSWTHWCPQIKRGLAAGQQLIQLPTKDFAAQILLTDGKFSHPGFLSALLANGMEKC